MIIGSTGVITIFGYTRAEEVNENDSLYTITETDRLAITNIDKITKEKRKVKVFDLKTKGKKGNIKVTSGVGLLLKGGEEDKWVSIEEIKVGNRIRCINNSVIAYELGDKLNCHYYTVKEVGKYIYNGYIYNFKVENNKFLANSILIKNLN